jgi:uroporphyrinogen decarboxylase
LERRMSNRKEQMDKEGRLTSRERVALAVAHQPTDRVPMGHVGRLYVDTLPRLESYLGVQGEDEIRERLGLDDRALRLTWQIEDADGSGKFRSLWGGVESALGHAAPYAAGYGPRPLRDAATIADVETFAWPDPGDFKLEALTPERIAQLQPFSVMGPTLPPIFCTLCELMGMDVALMNLLWAPHVVEAALARITEIVLELERRVLDTYGVLHQIRIWDDVADKRRMLFKPELWRRLVRPHMAKTFALAKSRNVLVHYHCCGVMTQILPDLIDLGMDILEPCQVHLPGMEPERLKREYGRHVTFWGAVNTQQTLPFGTPDDVRREVRERIQVLGRDGGYVLSPDHSLMPDVPLENIVALYDEGARCGLEL